MKTKKKIVKKKASKPVIHTIPKKVSKDDYLTAVISGGSAGIGFEITKLLVKKGFKVICLDIQKPNVKIENLIYRKCDISKKKSIQKALRNISGIDLIINNAGIMRRGDTLASSIADFENVYKVNIKGSWLLLKCCLPKLSKEPILLQISSRHGVNPKPNPGLYSLSKNYVEEMAKLIDKAHPEMTVKIASPGSVDTKLGRHGESKERLATKKMSQPHDIAKKIIELLESKTKKKLIFDEKKLRYYLK